MTRTIVPQPKYPKTSSLKYQTTGLLPDGMSGSEPVSSRLFSSQGKGGEKRTDGWMHEREKRNGAN